MPVVQGEAGGLSGSRPRRLSSRISITVLTYMTSRIFDLEIDYEVRIGCRAVSQVSLVASRGRMAVVCIDAQTSGVSPH